MTDKPNEPMLPPKLWVCDVPDLESDYPHIEWYSATPKETDGWLNQTEYVRADKYYKLREALEKVEKHLAEYITCDPMLRGGRSEKLLEEVREALKGNE